VELPSGGLPFTERAAFDPMRVLVVVNPGASRAEGRLQELSTWFLDRSDATFIAAATLAELKQALAEHGPHVDRIVIGGGDGTISAALPQLLALGKPVAVLPLGTANDFARTLGLPQDGFTAAEVALDGREHKIDIGNVNGHPFVNVASVGIAAKVVTAQSTELKRGWRVFSYLISLFRALRESRAFFVTMELDGKQAWSGVVYQVSVGNGRFHGGGLRVAEHAAIDDGKLDVCMVCPGAFWQMIACLAHLKFGLTKPAALKERSATTVTLRTSKPRPIDVDGELSGTTPARFALLPQAVTVIVPRELPANHRGLAELA
jgi:diacylglycerol kinase (ATP)